MKRRPKIVTSIEGFYHGAEHARNPSWPYSYVEAMMSPHGLIVMAHLRHHDRYDGIHPVSLSSTISTRYSAVESLPGCATYAVHYLSHHAHGGLVYDAFGRQVNVGDDEAPSLSGRNLSLEVLGDNDGLIVNVLDDGRRIGTITRLDGFKPVYVGAAE